MRPSLLFLLIPLGLWCAVALYQGLRDFIAAERELQRWHREHPQ